MSAPHIPNLNSLRRGGLRSRGTGPKSGPLFNQQPTQGREDEIVRNTDNDAATSRLSAVEAGYLDDPFTRLLNADEEISRRLPLMNRGTHARTRGIDHIVDRFLSQCSGRKQIISLGAGSDTRYFQIQRRGRDRDLIYHELDFAQNTKTKIIRLQSPDFVQTSKQLCGIDLSSPDALVSENGSRFESPQYHIHPQDLRLLTPDQPPPAGIDTKLPTLIISECCLIYLQPQDADRVLRYFTQLLSPQPLAIVIYEPIKPHDAFGRTMVSNLTARGIHLQTLEKYSDLPKQKQRLLDHGFHGGIGAGVEAVDIEWIWKKGISESEKERVDGLEWMDEVEEFFLLAQHYCISWGWRGFSDVAQWQGLSAPAGWNI